MQRPTNQERLVLALAAENLRPTVIAMRMFIKTEKVRQILARHSVSAAQQRGRNV